MSRASVAFAAALLAGTCLSGSAQAGLFDWGSSKAKPAQTDVSQTAPATANLDDEIRQAQLQRAAGDFSGATKSLAQMMLVYPDDPRVVGEYGKVLAQQGRSQDAVNFLKRATELQPEDWTLFSALGVAYDQLNDTASATTCYERALQLKPGEAVVLNNYGLSRLLAGDVDGAQHMLALASQTPNGDPKIASNLKMALALKPAAAAPAIAVAANRPQPKAIQTASLAPVSAQAPAASVPANVVMQKVPFDPKAGPVAVAKAARPATHEPRQLAANAKPVKTAAAAAKKKDATPSLRMTADASAP